MKLHTLINQLQERQAADLTAEETEEAKRDGHVVLLGTHETGWRLRGALHADYEPNQNPILVTVPRRDTPLKFYRDGQTLACCYLWDEHFEIRRETERLIGNAFKLKDARKVSDFGKCDTWPEAYYYRHHYGAGTGIVLVEEKVESSFINGKCIAKMYRMGWGYERMDLICFEFTTGERVTVKGDDDDETCLIKQITF